MNNPAQITFRGFDHQPELATYIRDRVDELSPIAGNRITAIHVVVELSHPHDRPRPLFHAHMDIELPGGVIAVHPNASDKPLEHRHENAYAAVRDTFDNARRELHDWEQRHHEAR